MADESKREEVAAAMGQINRAWLSGQVGELTPMVHPEIVMVFPDFSGRIQGRDEFLAGFHDFCANATIEEYREHEQQVDVAGDTVVVNFRYEMTYARSGNRYRSTGRDLWVFQMGNGAWIAAWRTMLDMKEDPV